MAELDKGKPVSLEELMVTTLALTKLLIEKGLITQAEFSQKLLEERAVYQSMLNAKTAMSRKPLRPVIPQLPRPVVMKRVLFEGELKRNQGSYYSILEITEGASLVVTLTGTGNVDLYVRRGAKRFIALMQNQLDLCQANDFRSRFPKVGAPIICVYGLLLLPRP